MKKKIFKIGFIINYRLDGWLGVTNYYKNLFNTIQKNNQKNCEIVILTDFLMTKQEEKNFKNIKIIKSKLFDRKSRFNKLFNLLSVLIIGKNYFIENFLIKNDISIISHTHYLGKNSKVPSLKWFPDFQELKYPNNFSFRQKIARKADVILASKHATKILVSSKSVQKGLKKINQNAYLKSSILYHTTNIDKKIKPMKLKELKKKFKIKKKYFYLPNQYWKHKNHIVVFKAIKELKKRGYNINLVTTGNSNDYRFPDHYSNLKIFMKNEKLEKNILYLGIIPIKYVYSLIKNSIAVINPSFFEGWGNTLEYAINLKKIAIISNIDVHREKISKNKLLFNPKNHIKLSNIMLKVFLNQKKMEKKIKAEKDKINSVIKFYSDYFKIIEENI